jgi:hypothetical protein
MTTPRSIPQGFVLGGEVTHQPEIHQHCGALKHIHNFDCCCYAIHVKLVKKFRLSKNV